MGIREAIIQIVREPVEKLGCELVDIEYKTENKHRILRLIIDKEAGVGIEDCADVSRGVEDLIEGSGVIDSAYELEVSSPGLDRPLVSGRDLERNLGKLVEVELKIHVDGRNRFEGILKSADEKAITITLDEPFIKGRRPKTNGEVRRFSRQDISSVKRAIRF